MGDAATTGSEIKMRFDIHQSERRGECEKRIGKKRLSKAITMRRVLRAAFCRQIEIGRRRKKSQKSVKLFVGDVDEEWDSNAEWSSS